MSLESDTKKLKREDARSGYYGIVMHLMDYGVTFQFIPQIATPFNLYALFFDNDLSNEEINQKICKVADQFHEEYPPMESTENRRIAEFTAVHDVTIINCYIE